MASCRLPLKSGSQVNRLGSKVGTHLALCCIHCMNRVNSRSALSTIKIIMVLLISVCSGRICFLSSTELVV